MRNFFSSKRSILLFVIPIFTIFLASAASWTESNLSVIANTQQKGILFFLWGLLMALYLRHIMKQLFILSSFEDKTSDTLLFIVSLLALLAVTTPYAPEQSPLRSFFHVAFAFAMPLVFLCALLRFLRFLYKKSPLQFRIFWFLTGLITFLSAGLLLKLGFVSSLLEIFITISICFLIRFLELRILETL